MKIGNFDLEKDGTYIIAELSANHNGSLQNALDTIKATKEIGANATKLQTYTADTLTLDCKKDDFMIDGGTLWDGKSLYELYKEALYALGMAHKVQRVDLLLSDNKEVDEQYKKLKEKYMNINENPAKIVANKIEELLLENR